MWIARDKNERLYLYEVAPYKNITTEKWDLNGVFVQELPKYDFPEVCWKDEKATEVDIKIINKNSKKIKVFIAILFDNNHEFKDIKFFKTAKERLDWLENSNQPSIIRFTEKEIEI